MNSNLEKILLAESDAAESRYFVENKFEVEGLYWGTQFMVDFCVSNTRSILYLCKFIQQNIGM